MSSSGTSAKLFTDDNDGITNKNINGTDSDSTSNSSMSRNTYIPSHNTVFKTSNVNPHNDEDADYTRLQQNIIPYCYKNSELLMWKGKVSNMIGE